MARTVRVLVAKPGLDGHDVGAKLLCRAFMAAGMEVTYTGLRQSAEAIARAAVQEGVDVVALSILSGAHLPLCRKIGERLRAEGLAGVVWIVGGTIPARDEPALLALGVHRIFPTGTPLSAAVDFVRVQVQR